MIWHSGTNLELDRERNTVSLIKEFAKKGGEASVWSVSRTGWLAKLYHRQPDANKVAKLKYMLANPPDDPERANGHCSIAWPSQLLLDPRHPSRPVVGFLMPQAPPSQELVVAFEFLHRIKWAPEFGWSALMLATVNLATAFECIHKKGYVVGDINEKNVLITREARVTLIDNDSFQVFDSRNKVLYRREGFRDLYQAPEMQGKEPKGYALGEVQDRFGLGVLIHQLLFCGRHPFNGVWQLDDDPPEYSELIKGHHYIYRTDSLMKPVAGWPSVTVLPAQVQTLFWRCFDRGHREPNQRPSAEEWRNELWKCLRELRQCSKYPQQHQYHSSNATCPWCEMLPNSDWFCVNRSGGASVSSPQVALSSLPSLLARPLPSGGTSNHPISSATPGGSLPKLGRPIWKLAIAILLLGGVIVTYFYTIRLREVRREVEFRSTPGAMIDLLHSSGDRRELGPIASNGTLLVHSVLEGNWRWTISRTNFRSISGNLSVLGNQARQIFNEPLVPIHGELIVSANPGVTLEIWRENAKLGSANELILLPTGTHQLELRGSGVPTETVLVEMIADKPLNIAYPTQVPNVGRLRVILEAPSYASMFLADSPKYFFVDGVNIPLPRSPHEVAEVRVGRHAVRIDIEGFESIEKDNIDIQASQTTEIRLSLQPLPARINIESDPVKAEIFRLSDGNRLGATGEPFAIPSLQEATLEIRASGWEAAGIVLPPLTPGSEHRRQAKLHRLTGPITATLESPWENTLGMRFVPIPGIDARFCIWETRLKDFQAFVDRTGFDATGKMRSWRAMGESVFSVGTWKDPGFAQGPTHPVVGVNSDDSGAFCKWLTEVEQREGKLPQNWYYRIPNNSEWEAATGQDTPINWGEYKLPAGFGNYPGTELQEVMTSFHGVGYLFAPRHRDEYPWTSPVGSFPPNSLGLYDLGGNAHELVLLVHPINHGSMFVLYGGGWDSHGEWWGNGGMKSPHPRSEPGSRDHADGFRVVVAPR